MASAGSIIAWAVDHRNEVDKNGAASTAKSIQDDHNIQLEGNELHHRCHLLLLETFCSCRLVGARLRSDESGRMVDSRLDLLCWKLGFLCWFSPSSP